MNLVYSVIEHVSQSGDRLQPVAASITAPNGTSILNAICRVQDSPRKIHFGIDSRLKLANDTHLS
jgi:hypothetical protein